MTRLKASLRRGNRCKLLHLGSSFWHPIVVDATPQMTSNVDAFRKATVRHVLREVPLGPLVILRPALLLCPGPRGAPVQRRRPKHANRSHPGTLLDASWWRSGRLRRAVVSQLLSSSSERALREPQIAIQSRPIQVCTLRRGSPYPDLP